MGTWDKIQRQVILRANSLQANSSAALATAYSNANIGQTEMDDRAIEFPKVAIDDAILNACDRIVRLIGLNRTSEYRTYFNEVTAGIASGGLIPNTANSKPRIGIIGEVRDSTTGQKVVERSYQEIRDLPNLATSVIRPTIHWYFSDNIRIWHSRTTVVIDVVTWDKGAQLTAMASNPRGTCPFPEDLHEAIVCGALTNLFKENLNNSQQQAWNALYQQTLATLAPSNG